MTLPKDSILYVAVFAAVGSGLMGGLLFAFSNFVMKALLEQPSASAIRTMQAINVTIVNPLFLAIFLGTALVPAILTVTALLRLSTPGMPLLLAGSALFLLGAFGVTMIFNVPLNNALATQEPSTAAAAQFWLTSGRRKGARGRIAPSRDRPPGPRSSPASAGKPCRSPCPTIPACATSSSLRTGLPTTTPNPRFRGDRRSLTFTRARGAQAPRLGRTSR